MKSMILQAPKPAEESPLSLLDLPVPRPGPGELLLHVSACGVCHTDLHTVEGELTLPKLPVVPGHQVVGRVEEVGKGVQTFRPGDRVGVPWLYSSCGQCAFCRRGEENLCENAQFTGLHVNGGYAEYMIARADFAYHIPERFSDIEAAPLLCAGIIGYRSLRLSEVKPGERLGLFGFGASAHLAIQVARHWGCEVFVFTRSEEHRRLAQELGAVWVGGPDQEPPASLDRAILFAPVGSLVPQILRVLRRGGTLAINAIHMSPIPELPYSLLYWERTIRSVANSTRRDAQEFLQVASEIPVRTTVEEYSLEEANRVLMLLKRGQIRGAAVLKI
ncbi:MAG: zinc-dependent alcohol dehydrogenase family protein [Armatimonadota bacterium]|nr:zinc-dependent alcohol dehydrogenase family protein [Armatimonadota bacterium]